MAARLNRRHSEMVRAKIKTAHILNALQACLDGKRILSKSQVQSAHILLNKSLSNAPEEKNVNVDMNGRIEVEFL